MDPRQELMELEELDRLMSRAGPAAYQEPVSATQAALIGAGKQFTRLGQGIKQPFAGPELAAQVADEQKRYQQLADARPVATAVGEALPLLALGPVGMGIAGALEHGTPTERATRAAAGLFGGKLGQYGGQLVGRALQPVRSAVGEGTEALFKKFGLDALPGQITNSAPMQWAESVVAKLPGGGRVRAVQEAQQAGLNREALAAMGGAGDSFTPEAVKAAAKAVGQTFNEVPIKTLVQIDKQAANHLVSVEKAYYKNLSPDQRAIVRQYIDDILEYGPNGMPGDVYQAARSRIAARAESTTDSELKTALKGVRTALDSAFNRSASEADKAAMATARKQWGAMKELGPLANVEGNISAARLARADIPGDLPKLASKLKNGQDSGTAQRLFYQSLLSGGVGAGAGLATGDPSEGLKYAAGSLAGPWLAAQLLTRAPTQRYLTKGMMNVTPEVEAVLKRLGASGGGLLGLSYAP